MPTALPIRPNLNELHPAFALLLLAIQSRGVLPVAVRGGGPGGGRVWVHSREHPAVYRREARPQPRPARKCANLLPFLKVSSNLFPSMGAGITT